MRILIAEDDAVSRRMLEVRLRKWGHEVIVTNDGEEALAALMQPDAPRLAILDWMMPGRDGLQVTRELRLHPQLPFVYVILLTAKDQKEDIVKALDDGADDYLIKPYDVDELRSRIGVGGRLVALHIELEEANRKLTHLAQTDYLTQLANRGAIVALLETEISRAKRRGAALSVAMVDIDHFKRINDSFGHAAGDAALIAVAERLRRDVRNYDLVGRFGGEEFLLVFPELSEEEAHVALERVCRSVSSAPVEIGNETIDITISAGAVWCGSSYLATADVDAITQIADAQLYLAKDAGRNRYQLAAFQ